MNAVRLCGRDFSSDDLQLIEPSLRRTITPIALKYPGVYAMLSGGYVLKVGSKT